ncbi:MAG: CvpA family protein [candidate division WOR-3 bacterium]
MSGIDIIILVIIGFGLINGLRSGFISELIALISLIVGILVGLKFYGILMPYVGNNETLSILGMFIISYFLSQFILNLILKPFIKITGRTAINSILGGILGAIEMTIFLSIIAYGIRWNDFYTQISQRSQILKIIEKSTFPIFDNLFKK